MEPMSTRGVIAPPISVTYPPVAYDSRLDLYRAPEKPAIGKIQLRDLRFFLLLLMPLIASCMLESQVQGLVTVQVSVEGSGFVTAENSSINCHMGTGAVCKVARLPGRTAAHQLIQQAVEAQLRELLATHMI